MSLSSYQSQSTVTSLPPQFPISVEISKLLSRMANWLKRYNLTDTFQKF